MGGTFPQLSRNYIVVHGEFWRREVTKALLIAAAALLLASCDGMAGFEGVNEDFHSSYQMTSGGHLDLTNKNGSLDVAGWDRDSVEVSGTKYAPDREGLRDVKVEIRQDGDRLTVRTETPKGDWRGGGYGVRFHIHVPRRFALDRLETTNGAITAEDLEGGGKVKSTNGKLVLARLTGDYTLETTNGAVEMDDLAGLQRATTTNGSVKGQLKEGNLEAETTNGAIDLTLMKPKSDRPVKLGTTNGSIKLAMAEFHSNPIHMETTHGSITLRLPSDVNARLHAETSLAKIESELPLSSTEEKSKHLLSGRFGSGGPAIDASTSTGGIHIEKY